jgi:hemoglobin
MAAFRHAILLAVPGIDELPSRIFHLALRAEWQEALDSGRDYRRSTLGTSLEDEGFIHCSFADQVQAIADLVYRGRSDVVLLEIDPSRLTAEVRVENLQGGTERFPHIYGPLPLQAVVQVIDAPPDVGVSAQRAAKEAQIGNEQPVRGMETVYEALGGGDAIVGLAAAWHARVLADEVVSHAFSHGYHPEHTDRLAAYWEEALGGPSRYSDTFGDETSVVRIHSGNGPHEDMDRRAIACFDQAMVDVGLSGDDRLRQVLHDYFAWATTTTMSRYHHAADEVPDGLGIPHWSWDGLVRGNGPADGP